MSLRHLPRVVLGVCVLAFFALSLLSFTRAIDDREQARYARDLRRLQALDSGLDEALLKARSGLLRQYDPLVAALGQIRRLTLELRRAPSFLGAGPAGELRARLDEYLTALNRKEELVELFKMENSVLQTSLHYFPVVATGVIDRARATAGGGELAIRVEGLSSAVMLFEAEGQPEALARVKHAQDELRQRSAEAAKVGLDRDVRVAVAHAQVILDRKPKLDALVQEVLKTPTGKRALLAEEAYSALFRAAADGALARKQWLFALALAVVVLGMTQVILGIRRSKRALETLASELQFAHRALALEHEHEQKLGELRNRFVAMTSHELRTPLTAIVSSAELLHSFGERWEAERRTDHLERIGLAARGMHRMLDDVLMIGRAEAGGLRPSPTPIRLDEFCRRLVETLEHSTQKSHTLRYTFLGDPDVTMDERLLQHVLGNLLGNAVKYSAPGTSVHFDVRASRDECSFTVKDSGIGIPGDHLPALFTTFSRAQNAQHLPGSGLGLAVVKKALDVQAGSIEVETELGRGTTFVVKIPRQLQNLDTPLTLS